MFSVHRILLPIDFSERCLEAARHTVPTLAKHFGSEVVVLHVLAPYRECGTAEPGLIPTEESTAARKAERRRSLDLFLTEELRGALVKRVLMEGDPAHTIVEYSHSENSDLIVLPTHGYGPFRRLLLGSVTSKVLHDADCAVWTGVHLEKKPSGEPLTLSHILCAIDLGPHSAKALDWANRLATEFGSKLTIVHVVALDPRTEDYYFAPEWRKYVMDRAKDDIEKLQRIVGTHADVDLETGDISKSVSFAAENLKADLVVIGRGATAGVLGRFRMHAYAIIRQSPCPVVSV
ncbi:MAG TPA: universal stress protein [Terriglobia bacterium]|nr:universal stress protein [Terriglobia bacterium]